MKNTNLVIIMMCCLGLSLSVKADSLSVKSIKINFDNGTNMTIVEDQKKLRAKLTLVYTGVGILQGRWLIAEPGSTEAKPLFRTLALVRENIIKSQRSYLDSPELPTNNKGKYLVSFCVSDRDLSSEAKVNQQCPNEVLSATGSYQVIAKAGSSSKE